MWQKKRQQKFSCFNDILVRISHNKKKKKTPPAQSVRTSHLHNLFVFNLCYNRPARTSGTAQNIREISGSSSYVPDFITGSLLTLCHSNWSTCHQVMFWYKHIQLRNQQHSRFTIITAFLKSHRGTNSCSAKHHSIVREEEKWSLVSRMSDTLCCWNNKQQPHDEKGENLFQR